MAAYRIEWKKSTTKDLHRIPPHDVVRIVDAVEALGREPFPAGHVKLPGSEGSCRIRIGDYRVVYEVMTGVRVGHRRDVYR